MTIFAVVLAACIEIGPPRRPPEPLLPCNVFESTVTGTFPAATSPPPPCPPPTFRGALVETGTGRFGEIVLAIQQSGATLSGQWTARFNSGEANAGMITGAVFGGGPMLSLQLHSSAGQCPLSVSLAVQDKEAHGTYASVDCPDLVAGTVHAYADGRFGSTYAPPLPGAPTDVVATAGDGQVTIRWTKIPGTSSHNVYWSTTPGVTPETGNQVLQLGEPATIAGFANGAPIHFIVAGTNASGEGPASSEVSATPTSGALNAPIGVAAQAAPGQVAITWPAVAGATGYSLYWSTTPGQAFGTGTKVTGVSSGHVLSGLANGTLYFFVVTATDGGGESAPSAEAHATPYLISAYDFEDGTLQGWIPTGSWAVISGARLSGTYAVTDSPGGNYANNSDAWLQSPAIDLSGSASPMLTFSHRCLLEPGRDWGRVEISTDSGASWTTLRTFSGLTNQRADAETIALKDYAGSSVLIRFRLVTGGSETADGWYLDDIVIYE